MPRKDGLSLVEDIRKENQLAPIIFLTAETQSADVIRGFETGADKADLLQLLIDHKNKLIDCKTALLKILGMITLIWL